ncbi:hypothetical protein AB0M43_37485 [Longispora sp. NPDC051575]|uniref:hypothetical protein n=1 Tax=Longispora sp. NPDC051575 TaxID=3154943 RepID=UPI00342B3DEA
MTAGRVFGPSDAAVVEWLPGRGSVVLAAEGHIGGEQRVGRRLADGAVAWWSPFRDQRAALGAVLGQRRLPGVLAAAVTGPADAIGSAEALGLALAVAEHLAAERDIDFNGGWARAVVTCPAPPIDLQPAGYLLLPHLISVDPATPSGALDRVMWEVLEPAVVEVVHGERLPPPCLRELIHHNLGTLLALRTRARTGHLPDSPLGRLIGELSSDGPMSGHILYRNAHRLAPLLGTHTYSSETQ